MIRHFISSNWEMKKYCLQAHYLPEDHTAVNILVVLSETLQQWKASIERIIWDNYGQ